MYNKPKMAYFFAFWVFTCFWIIIDDEEKINALKSERGSAMQSKFNQILGKIEELRNELELLLNDKGIGDKEIIDASRELDSLLNEYNRLLREKEK